MKTLRQTRLKGWLELVREICPVCGKTGGCMIHKDGNKVACIRMESKTPFSVNSAVPSWLHWLKGEKKKDIDQKSVEAAHAGEKKREDQYLNAAYGSFLDCSELSDQHYAHLTSEKRQLNDAQVAIRQYRSLPEKPWQVVKDMAELHGIEDLKGVPGFYEQKGKYGSYWTLSAREGIVIPYRNYKNQIVGAQVRTDNPPNEVELDRRSNDVKAYVKEQPNVIEVMYKDQCIMREPFELKETKLLEHNGKYLGKIKLVPGQRYFWLSSAKKPKGSSPGSPIPVHVSVPSDELRTWESGTVRKAKAVWLSEGGLKCDIAVDKIKSLYNDRELESLGTTMLAVPGVGSWRIVLPILKEMGVETVNIAVDADAITNIYVKKHLLECAKTLKEEGYKANLVRWSQNDAVGIDDLFIAKKIPQITKLY